MESPDDSSKAGVTEPLLVNREPDQPTSAEAAAPVETKEAGEEAEAPRPQPLTPCLCVRRRVYLTIHMLIVVLPVAVAIFGLAADLTKASPFSVRRSTCDVAGALVAHAVAVVALTCVNYYRDRRGLFDNKLPTTDVLHHTSLLGFILGVGKLWVYHWGANGASAQAVAESAVGGVLVALLVVVPALSMIANHFVHRIDYPSKIHLKPSSVGQILKPYFWPRGFMNRLLIIGTWLLMGIGKAAGVIAPLFLAKAVNQMKADPPESPYASIAIFGTLSLAPRVLEEVQDIMVVNIWRVAYVQVAAQTFRHIHGLSLEWHLKKKMGHVIRYMDRGMEAAQNLVAYVAMYIGPAVAVAISAFIVFATEFNQPEVAAVTFLFMSLYGWLTVIVTIWRKIFFTEMNQDDNDMHDKATDSLVNFETVKYFTNEAYEEKKYVESVESYQMNQQKSRLSVAMLNMAQASVMEYCRVCALMVAATAVMNHEDGFDLGKFVALQAYLSLIFSPFQFLGTIYEMTVQSMVDMQNLSELLGEEPDLVDSENAVPLRTITSAPSGAPRAVTTLAAAASARPEAMSVEFKDVVFHYPTQAATSGLQKVSFYVAPGTTTALVGTTGSGKTTTTRLLFRFYDVLEGAVLVNGQDVRTVEQQSLRKHIGIVPQDTVLFNESIRHNVLYGRPEASEEEMIEAARAAQLLPLIDRLENGWDTVVGERGLKLSGGEKQRVAIARCLLKNPPIVVLDEATSALDNKTEKEVQQALTSLAGRTTIVVAHRLSTVRNADQILVMQRGRVVERGTFDELLAREGSEFAAMWNAQLRAATDATADADADDRPAEPAQEEPAAEAPMSPQE